MKQLNSFKTALSALLVILCGISFTSCDEDQMEASTLHGEWQGDFGMNYSYNHNGRSYRYDSYDTSIRFNQSGFSNHGTGTQCDYYRDGPYKHVYYDFDWRIENGVIKLRYRWAQEYDTDIRDYVLNNDYFRGIFGYTNTHFSLSKLYNYNWNFNNNYYDSYGYGCDPYSGWGYYPYPYYAPAANGVSVVKQSESDSLYCPQPSEMRIGNRYADEQSDLTK